MLVLIYKNNLDHLLIYFYVSILMDGKVTKSFENGANLACDFVKEVL